MPPKDARALPALDNQLDELEVAREKLVQERASAERPAEDFQERIAKVKAQFDPANVEISIRRLIFKACNNSNEDAKQRLKSQNFLAKG